MEAKEHMFHKEADDTAPAQKGKKPEKRDHKMPGLINFADKEPKNRPMKRNFIALCTLLLAACGSQEPKITLFSNEAFQTEADGKPVGIYTLHAGDVTCRSPTTAHASYRSGPPTVRATTKTSCSATRRSTATSTMTANASSARSWDPTPTASPRAASRSTHGVQPADQQ